MENRLHAKMGVGERIDGDLEIAFESATVRSDMEIDVVNSGRHSLII